MIDVNRIWPKKENDVRKSTLFLSNDFDVLVGYVVVGVRVDAIGIRHWRIGDDVGDVG